MLTGSEPCGWIKAKNGPCRLRSLSTNTTLTTTRYEVRGNVSFIGFTTTLRLTVNREKISIESVGGHFELPLQPCK